MSEKEHSDHWWQTVPGVLTGLAALVTAIGGLIVVFREPTPDGENRGEGIKWGIDLPAYVVLDSAWKTEQEAQRRLVALSSKGYSETGFFWIPDFKFLSGKKLYQVYVGPFKDRTNAIEAACQYDKNFQTKTYGVRLSSKPGRDEFRCSDNK